MKTKGLYPERVFYFFEEISKIPRGSKKEEKISNWIVNFAKERNLNVFQDESLNVIIYKPATKGYEEFSPLIIQGHMDMVWEKNRDTVFDFETQGIDLIIENNVIKANKTTLGADNGIAVAYALALLDSNDIKHPALEILITTDEEAGMSGVSNLDPSLFNGHTLLNIDTEDYGEIYVSSAGGSRVKNVFELTKEKIETHTNHHFFSIDVKGLKGGHSGTDIDKNLGNANKILGDILYHITKKYNFNIISLNGGDKMNAIPREAIAILNVDLSTSTSEDFKTLISLATDVFKKEYSKT
ncbi:MAG: beta-Ala-His dipeptidase, partial [Leptotrichiaceae bacterium]